MSRIIGATLLMAACVCVEDSRSQADDRTLGLFQQSASFFQRTQDISRAPTVRGQTPSVSRGVPGPASLPRGRAYYNIRYFGNFNNRFYGPQYGYF